MFANPFLTRHYPRVGLLNGFAFFAALLVSLLMAHVPTACASVLKSDLVYGNAAGTPLLLDACVPEGDGPHPIAILIHGGGWSGGDKAADPAKGGADIAPWFEPLTQASFLWFSINYRLAPQHRWPACLEDVNTAIRWVKANASRFRGDASRIILVGHSAGGHLAFLAAAQSSAATRIQGVIGFAPVTDFEFELPMRGGLSPSLQKLHDRPKEVTPESLAILRATAPIHHVKPGLPPFMILHGDADRTVPLEESVRFRDKLLANGVRCDLLVLKGAQHRLAEWHKSDPAFAAKMVAWMKETLASETEKR